MSRAVAEFTFSRIQTGTLDALMDQEHSPQAAMALVAYQASGLSSLGHIAIHRLHSDIRAMLSVDKALTELAAAGLVVQDKRTEQLLVSGWYSTHTCTNPNSIGKSADAVDDMRAVPMRLLVAAQLLTTNLVTHKGKMNKTTNVADVAYAGAARVWNRLTSSGEVLPELPPLEAFDGTAAQVPPDLWRALADCYPTNRILDAYEHTGWRAFPAAVRQSVAKAYGSSVT